MNTGSLEQPVAISVHSVQTRSIPEPLITLDDPGTWIAHGGARSEAKENERQSGQVIVVCVRLRSILFDMKS